MNPQNGFNDIEIFTDGQANRYSIKHLENICITIPDLKLHNNQIVSVSVYMRPTNHLYSVRFDEEIHDEAALSSTGELLRRYNHVSGNYQALSSTPPVISTEKRVFCSERYQQSFLFPLFVNFLEDKITGLCVLANNGDDRTCLSMLFRLPQEYGYEVDDRYLVFFKLTKINGNEINMLIDTGFVVKDSDFRAEKIESSKYRHGKKPFIVILKNILAGHKPFESPPLPKKKFRKKGGGNKKA